MSKSNQKGNAIKNPFDALFKHAMENVDMAKDVLQLVLPKPIAAVTNFNLLELCPQSFIDTHLTYKHVDLLYRTEIQGQAGYIYLLTEAQKEPDADIPFRLMQYVLRIIDHHRKQFNTKEFPLVYPVIYYLGKKPYSYSTDFFEGFGENKELAKSILTNPFQVEHVIAECWDDFNAHPLACTLANIFMMAYSRDIINDLRKIASGFYYIEQHYGSDLILSMLKFMLQKVEKGNVDNVIQTVAQMVTEEMRGDIMTLAKQLEQRGMQTEKYIIANKLLKKGMIEDLVVEITNLDVTEVRKLKQELEPT